MSFATDYERGTAIERQLKPILERYFDDALEHMPRYSSIDFRGRFAVYELKSRNMRSTRYPTTMIGQDKLRADCVYVFHFYDGTFFIKYDSALFSTFDVRVTQRHREDFSDLAKPHVFIPIRHLTKIEFAE
jgi:hypothetical protein